MSDRSRIAPNDLNAFWMPFTANRQFKKEPRLFVAAEGMYYTTSDGRQVLDGTSGMWCCNAGHKRPRIVEAIQKQAAELHGQSRKPVRNDRQDHRGDHAGQPEPYPGRHRDLPKPGEDHARGAKPRKAPAERENVGG